MAANLATLQELVTNLQTDLAILEERVETLELQDLHARLTREELATLHTAEKFNKQLLRLAETVADLSTR